MAPSLNCELPVGHIPKVTSNVSIALAKKTYLVVLHLITLITWDIGYKITEGTVLYSVYFYVKVLLFSIMSNGSSHDIDLCVWYVIPTYIASSTWLCCCSCLLCYMEVIQLLISYAQHDFVIINTGPLSDYVCVTYMLFRNMFGHNKVCYISSSYDNIIAKSQIWRRQIATSWYHFLQLFFLLNEILKTNGYHTAIVVVRVTYSHYFNTSPLSDQAHATYTLFYGIVAL